MSPVSGAPHTHTHTGCSLATVPEVFAFLCCVGVRACSYMWLWWVLPQRLNHRARAVKAPVRFPLRAWPRCRREDLQASGCSQCAPPPAAGLQDPQAARAAGGGRWCVFFWTVVGAGGCSKK